MKYLADIKSTFDSIIFEWDETKSNIQNVYNFVDIFLKITDPYNKISTISFSMYCPFRYMNGLTHIHFLVLFL